MRPFFQPFHLLQFLQHTVLTIFLLRHVQRPFCKLQLTYSSYTSPWTRPVVTLSATPPLLASSLLHIVLLLLSLEHTDSTCCHSCIPSHISSCKQSVSFFDLMSIVLSLLFTCWLHLLSAVHSPPCLRLLRSCWWAAHNLPWEGLRYLTVSLLFFAAPFPPTHIEHHLFFWCHLSNSFSTSMFATLFSKPPHALALTYIFPSNTPSCDVDLHVLGVSMVMELSLYQLRFFFHVCVTCHQPCGAACVSSAFSRLRNSSRRAVTCCVKKKVANACCPCSTSIHPCTILPSLPGIGSASFFHCERRTAHHHQKRKKLHLEVCLFSSPVLPSVSLASFTAIFKLLFANLFVEQLFRLFAVFSIPNSKKSVDVVPVLLNTPSQSRLRTRSNAQWGFPSKF